MSCMFVDILLQRNAARSAPRLYAGYFYGKVTASVMGRL